MTNPSVEEIVARLADRMSRLDYEFGITVNHADLAIIIADWRKRGEALEPFARQKVEEMLSMDELELDHDDFIRARAALTPQQPPQEQK